MLDLVVQFLHTTRLSINFGIILLIFKMKYKKETLFATTALVSITLPVFVVYNTTVPKMQVIHSTM